ncbi:Protein tipD [Entamoeba marina]
MDLSKLHTLLSLKLEKRDKLQKEPFKVVTKCYGGGEMNETKELEEEITKLKQENIDVVKDFHKISVKLTTVEQEKKAMEQELQQFQSQMNEKGEEVAVLQTKNDEIVNEVKQKMQMIDVIRQESSAHQIHRIKLEDDLKRLNTQNHRIMDEYAKLEQELRVMKDLYSKVQDGQKQTQHRPVVSAQTPLNRNENAPVRTDSNVSISPSQLPKETYRQIIGHSSDILCMKYNANGAVLATASADKTVKLWDVASGKIKSSFGGVLQSFTDVAFAPTGDMILGTSNDGTAKIWYLANSRLRHSLTGHNGKVTCGDFFSSDKVMTGSHDRTLKTWDVNKGYCLKTTVCYSSCNCMMMGGMGNLIITGHCDNTVRFWDNRSKECIDVNRKYHTGSVSDIINNVIQYVDGNTRQIIHTFSSSDFSVANTSRISCSPDGKYIVSGSSNGDVYCWDIASKKLESVLSPKVNQTAAPCYSVAWNPSQSQIVSGHGSRIFVWEV